MIVYLDIIFLENLLMNAIILTATAIIIKTKLSPLRIFISSFIGSIYAVLCYMHLLPILSNLLLKILLSMVMIYISFVSKTPKMFFKSLLLFYLTSFTFGGVSLSLIYFLNSNNISLQNRHDTWKIPF